MFSVKTVMVLPEIIWLIVKLNQLNTIPLQFVLNVTMEVTLHYLNLKSTGKKSNTDHKFPNVIPSTDHAQFLKEQAVPLIFFCHSF